MAGFSVQGAAVTFTPQNGSPATVTATRLSIETPQAALVDMTSASDPLGANVMVPTGDTSPGSMSVDFIATNAFLNPQAIVGSTGILAISAPGYSLSRNAVLQAATVDHQSGDIVRGTLRFTITDYYQ